jgi:hypothetical protein
MQTVRDLVDDSTVKTVEVLGVAFSLAGAFSFALHGVHLSFLFVTSMFFLGSSLLSFSAWYQNNKTLLLLQLTFTFIQLYGIITYVFN